MKTVKLKKSEVKLVKKWAKSALRDWQKVDSEAAAGDWRFADEWFRTKKKISRIERILKKIK